MMKNITISILLIFSSLTFANNHFIYLRYNPSEGNSSLVVHKINEIINDTNECFVIFYSENQPIIAKNIEEWDKMKNYILAKQSNSTIIQERENIMLDNLFNEIFNESIVNVQTNLQLKGISDDSWQCTFILSDKMYDAGAIPYECIEINELKKRMTVNFITYSEDTITIKR